MRKWILMTIVGAAILGIGIAKNLFIPRQQESEADAARRRQAIRTPTKIPTPTKTPTPKPLLSSVLQTVPFAAQAPFGGWSDPRQQDGCEEASVLMAMHWVKGTTFTQQAALDEILLLSSFGEINFGTFHDTSTEDTLRFFHEYYHYDKVQLVREATVTNIIQALRNGSVVIVPTNGRLLKNPNFTAPGPEHHMLVIIGFDDKTKVFITNDPGTRQGKNYKYSYSTLYNSIADYPTGNHLSRTGITKPMIIVSK
jgi:hypothetical protein